MPSGRAPSANSLLVLVTVLAAFGWVFSKEALTTLAPMLFLWIRFWGAALIVGMGDPKALWSLSATQRRRALITGMVLGLQTSLWALGLYHAEHLGVGAFLISLGFVLIPVVGALLFGMRSRPYTWVAVLVAVPGLGFLSLDNGFEFSVSDILFLASAVLYAFYFNFNGRYSAAIPAIPLTAIQLAGAGLVALAGSVIFESAFTELRHTPVGLSVIGWVVASILIATGLRFFLLVKAQASAPEAHGAVIMTLEPVWVALLGALWFGEQMSQTQLLGSGLIFCALLINAGGSELHRRRQLPIEQVERVDETLAASKRRTGN